MVHYSAPQEHELPYIDGEAIVIDKPAGLPVSEPRRGGVSVENWLDALRFGFGRRPLPVHRLDQDTSGCLLLARNPKAHKRFHKAFEDRLVSKTYWGIVENIDVARSGTIDLPLGKTSSAEAGWRMVVDPAGKSAVTHWRRLAVRGNLTLIEFSPETGRTHQIRAHALYGLGAGLMGDSYYLAPGAELSKLPMMLHSASLRIQRPGKPDIFAQTRLPARFQNQGFTADDLIHEDLDDGDETPA